MHVQLVNSPRRVALPSTKATTRYAVLPVNSSAPVLSMSTRPADIITCHTPPFAYRFRNKRLRMRLLRHPPKGKTAPKIHCAMPGLSSSLIP